MADDARRWLEEFFGPIANGGDHLPERLLRWFRQQRRLWARAPGGDLVPRWQEGGGARLMVGLTEISPKETALLLVREPVANGPAQRAELTPREDEVLHWIAGGKSNPEIATILGISPRTVHKHVQHVLDKLGVPNRSSAMLCVLQRQRMLQSTDSA
jgi:DNA-binding CsgD family transcriptional regulator